MDTEEITMLETVLEEFFNSAPGRRKTVSVRFEHKIDRKGILYVNAEIGFEDELQQLQTEHGFTINTVQGVRPSQFEDTKVGIDMRVPDPIPTNL